MPLLFLGKWLLWELSCANESTLIDRCSVPCKGEWVKKRERKRPQLSLKATVHLSSPLKSPLFTLTFPFVRSFPIHYPCFCRILIVHKVDSIFLSKQRQSQSQSLRPTEFDESVSQSTIFASFSRQNAWLTLPFFWPFCWWEQASPVWRGGSRGEGCWWPTCDGQNECESRFCSWAICPYCTRLVLRANKLAFWQVSSHLITPVVVANKQHSSSHNCTKLFPVCHCPEEGKTIEYKKAVPNGGCKKRGLLISGHIFIPGDKVFDS